MSGNKTFLIACIMALVLFASQWIFNHLSPWLGIVLLIGSGWVLFNYLTKQSKQNEKKS